jgi:hypothetical protein
MIKLETKLVDGEQQFTTIERETGYVLHGRPVCVALKLGGVDVWLKGTRSSYSVPYDALYRNAERSSISIAKAPALRSTSAAVANLNREMEASLRKLVRAVEGRNLPGEDVPYALERAKATLNKLETV